MNPYYDIAIVGAGPAGTAAAIFARLCGLTVCLIESKRIPKSHPGETLHPGLECIFKQLNVWNEIVSLNLIRHEGHFINGQFTAYGNNWLGFQIKRDELDKILQHKAKEMGVVLLHGHHVKATHNAGNKILFLETRSTIIKSRFYIDATGASHLFARHMKIDMAYYSKKLIAYYGYLDKAPCVNLPAFVNTNQGWCWYAAIEPNRFAWVHLGKINDCPYKPQGGADVTWRLAKQIAGDNFFLTGDAAGILDPSAGHGILRALMSGMMAVFLIKKIKMNKITQRDCRDYYSAWFTTWFQTDARFLSPHSHIYTS